MAAVLSKAMKRARDIGSVTKSAKKSKRPAYTLDNAFADISTSPPEWSDRTRKEYKARLLRITKIAMMVSGMTPPSPPQSPPPSTDTGKTTKNIKKSSEPVLSEPQAPSPPQPPLTTTTVDLVELFGSVDIIDKIGSAITQESRAKGTVKDYMQALSSLARKSSPDGFGARFPPVVLEHVERMVRDNKSIRQVADVRRTYTDDGHEPYENIQAAGEWYESRGDITQDALIVSMYADNPIFVRDDYGSVMMDYGTERNKRHGVPEPDRTTDTYYDVMNGRLYITSYKNAKHRGHRPYDIQLSDKTRSIIDRQLIKEKRRKMGYRHYLIHAPGQPNKPMGKLGGSTQVLDKALRGAKGVQFKTAGVIGTNHMRSSYVTYRLSQPGMTLDEMLLLARDMRHSFAVQQLVYQRLNSTPVSTN
jgi:hypothetical protein